MNDSNTPQIPLGDSAAVPAVPYADLQVPGEPGVWFCARHKNVKTRLRCGRCEKPICPNCTVMGPAGARCRECASTRGSTMYKVSPAQMGVSFVMAVGMGVAGAVIAQVLAGLWFLSLFLAPTIGPLLGQIIGRVTGGKRGPVIATVVSLGLVVGGLGSSVGWTLYMFRQGFDDDMEGLEEISSSIDKLPAEQAAHVRQQLHIHHTAMSTELLLSMTLMNWPLWAFLIIAIIAVWWWLK